ncbi:MAG: GIY-YIG nuclease family protein [Cyclobacterium sp.]|uniref:GIY-YIG nuclease family protein n=1 Tax=Cyclobacterium sp. TaxID=1966343 RepID=UPI003970F756
MISYNKGVFSPVPATFEGTGNSAFFCYFKAMFTVYALYSEKFDKIYIGFTSDLQKRLISHNELGTKGWTIKFRPWKLVYNLSVRYLPSSRNA